MMVFPALLKALDDSDDTVRNFASEALVGVGEGAAVDLADALLTERHSPRFRRAVIDVLAQMGPIAKAAIPALREAAEGKDQDVRGSAARALERIQGQSAREEQTGPSAEPANPE